MPMVIQNTECIHRQLSLGMLWPAPLRCVHSAPPHPYFEGPRGRRASSAKGPDEQQLAHNKSSIKYLLSTPEKPQCINAQSSHTHTEGQHAFWKNSNKETASSLLCITPMPVPQSVIKLKKAQSLILLKYLSNFMHTLIAHTHARTHTETYIK